MKFFTILMMAVTILLLIGPALLRTWTYLYFKPNVYDLTQPAPAADVALVLGAGLWRDGSPTPVLHDRVYTAANLYKEGRVQKLLMSGDNSHITYNEPAAMRRLALQLGVPDEDIVLDYAGRRTYDSCYRAREIFQVRRAVVVTQRFHLDRALYLCQSLGLETVGVSADRRNYRAASRKFWHVREVAATVRAWLDINVLQPQPILGDKLPIELVNNPSQTGS